MDEAKVVSPEFCDRCGYNRQGLPSPGAACPECEARGAVPDPLNSLAPTELSTSIWTMRFVVWSATVLWITLESIGVWVALGYPEPRTAWTAILLGLTSGIGGLTLSMWRLAWTPLPGTGGWWWGSQRHGQSLSACPIGLALTLPGITAAFVFSAEALWPRLFDRAIVLLPKSMITLEILAALFLTTLLGLARLMLHAASVLSRPRDRPHRQSLRSWIVATAALSGPSIWYVVFINRNSTTFSLLGSIMFLPMLLLAFVASRARRHLTERLDELQGGASPVEPDPIA